MSKYFAKSTERALLVSASICLAFQIAFYGLYFSGLVDDVVAVLFKALSRNTALTFGSISRLLTALPIVLSLCLATVVFALAKWRLKDSPSH